MNIVGEIGVGGCVDGDDGVEDDRTVDDGADDDIGLGDAGCVGEAGHDGVVVVGEDGVVPAGGREGHGDVDLVGVEAAVAREHETGLAGQTGRGSVVASGAGSGAGQTS